jgi:glyoxylase-like metal-dependent hydrolase (beta-lactamase superfamily II)
MQLISRGHQYAVFEFGALQVTSLRDGYVDMPPTRLRDEHRNTLTELPDSVSLVGGNLRLSVNAFHISNGTTSLLIDTGASNAWHPTMGSLYEALNEAGIDRNDITEVAITHNHEDHVNGLIAPDGTEAFPKLQHVWIGSADASIFAGRLEPVRDRVVPISGPTAINTWATAIPTAGHTPGHTIYDITAPRDISWCGATRSTSHPCSSTNHRCPGSSTVTKTKRAPHAPPCSSDWISPTTSLLGHTSIPPESRA